jgi:hypothetical protein
MRATRLRQPEDGNGIANRLNAAFVRWPLVFVITTAALYGGGRSDYREFVQFAVNPFNATLPADKQFLYSSPLNLWIAAALSHLVGDPAAYALTACLAVLAVALAWQSYAKTFAPETRRALLFVVFSTPMLILAGKWIGKGDLFLTAAYLLILSRNGRAFLSGVAACVMVLAHRELGTVVLAGHCFLRRQISIPLVLGGAFGLAMMFIYQHDILPPVAATRAAIILTRGSEIIRLNAMQPISHVVFGLGWFWIFLAVRWQQTTDWRIFGFLVFAFALAFVTIDYSRDLIMISLPLIFLTAEGISQGDASTASLPLSFPFPMLFLIQVQFLKQNTLVDSNWTSLLVH